MHGILPPKVLQNLNRGRQSADILERVLRNRCEIKTELDSFEKSELAQYYLNIPELKLCLDRLTTEKNWILKLKINQNLLTGLAVGIFLKGLE